MGGEDLPLGTAVIAGTSLGLRAVLADVSLDDSRTSGSTGNRLWMGTYEARAVIALGTLNTVAGQVTYTTAGVAAAV